MQLVLSSIYQYSYPSTHSRSGQAAGDTWEESEVRLKMAVIKWTKRCTLSPWSCEFGYALAERDNANWKPVIEPVWSCTRRPWSCKLGGHDQMSLEKHLEAMIEWNWKSTWRWSIWTQSIRRHNIRWRCFDRFVNLQLWKCDELMLPLSSYGELAGGTRSVWRHTASWCYIPSSTTTREKNGRLAGR